MRKKGKVKKAAKAVAAHVMLANAILRGEIPRPCSLSVLRFMYFKASSDAECERKLAAWAKRHGILYEKRPLRIDGPGVKIDTFEVIFRRR